MQHGLENLPLEEEVRVQLKQPSVALNAGSFYASWTEPSSGELVIFEARGEKPPGKRGHIERLLE